MFVQVTNNVSKRTSDVSRMTRQDFILGPSHHTWGGGSFLQTPEAEWLLLSTAVLSMDVVAAVNMLGGRRAGEAEATIFYDLALDIAACTICLYYVTVQYISCIAAPAL